MINIVDIPGQPLNIPGNNLQVMNWCIIGSIRKFFTSLGYQKPKFWKKLNSDLTPPPSEGGTKNRKF